MRRTDSIYGERYQQHNRDGCVSMAPAYRCKLCRSYEAGRAVGLDLVRELLAADPVIRAEGEHDRCLYCRAELKGGPAHASKGHEPSCPWRSARLVLEEADGRSRRRAK
jgi:hypothetical protein